MPLLLCVPTVAVDSDNKSVTYPAPGPGFSQLDLLSQGGKGETRFQVKTNISTIQSKSSFNTSPNTGVRLRTALFSSTPSGCHQQHKGITEQKMRCCHQNRLYLHSHEVQRDQTPVTEHSRVCHGPKQQCTHPKAHLLQHWEPLACPSTVSQVPEKQRPVSRVHPAAFWIRIMASQLLAPS